MSSVELDAAASVLGAIGGESSPGGGAPRGDLGEGEVEEALGVFSGRAHAVSVALAEAAACDCRDLTEAASLYAEIDARTVPESGRR